MAKKKILVKDVLNLFQDDTQEICCMFYAYGVYYGDTSRDGLKTVKACKDQMIYDCLNAMVTSITFDKNDHTEHMVINAEIVH